MLFDVRTVNVSGLFLVRIMERTFVCFICGKVLEKLSASSVLHMGLADGDPVCPKAFSIDETSKEFIRSVVSRSDLDTLERYEALQAMNLEHEFSYQADYESADAFLEAMESTAKKTVLEVPRVRDQNQNPCDRFNRAERASSRGDDNDETSLIADESTEDEEYEYEEEEEESGEEWEEESAKEPEKVTVDQLVEEPAEESEEEWEEEEETEEESVEKPEKEQEEELEKEPEEESIRDPKQEQEEEPEETLFAFKNQRDRICDTNSTITSTTTNTIS